jgi:hypothetical protein
LTVGLVCPRAARTPPVNDWNKLMTMHKEFETLNDEDETFLEQMEARLQAQESAARTELETALEFGRVSEEAAATDARTNSSFEADDEGEADVPQARLRRAASSRFYALVAAELTSTSSS